MQPHQKIYAEIGKMDWMDALVLVAIPSIVVGLAFLDWSIAEHIMAAWGQSWVQFFFGVIGFTVVTIVDMAIAVFGGGACQCILTGVFNNVRHNYR